MILLRVGRFIALWATVLVLGGRAYMASVLASTVDTRLAWGLPLILAAQLMGHGLAALAARRRPGSWRSLAAAEHGLCLLVAGLCTVALSHVPANNTITSIREQVPPVLGWGYPLLALLVPLILRRRQRFADPFLWLAAAALPLGGSLLLLEPPSALCLAGLALLEQLTLAPGRWQRRPLLLVPTALVGLLSLATLVGRNPLHASPSLDWILAGTLLMLAVASRPRDVADLKRLLMAPLLTALIIALCSLALTVFLALNVELMPALRTRLTLFRQHPNFLAPFFSFEALVALGLARSSARRSWALLACATILAAATWMTDSRSGTLLLLAGLLIMVVAPWLRRHVARIGRGTLLASCVAWILLVLAGLGFLSSERGQALSAASLDRFEKSLDYRLDAWRNAWAVIESNPWIGIGPHTFISEFRFQPGSRFFNEPTSPHPHNVPLYVAQSAGIPALLLFLLWSLALWAALWRSASAGPRAGSRVSPGTAAESGNEHPAQGPDDDAQGGAAGRLPPRLCDALLGASLALMLANQLDVGLALDTVIPEPFFLLTGLLLAASSRSTSAALPTGPALFRLAGVAALFVPLGLDGVAARRHLDQARLQAFLSTPAAGSHASMDDAIASAETALALDPDLEPGYELLARWYESREGGFSAAHALLTRMADRAPHYGLASSLLGHLYMRSMMFAEAAEALTTALADEHGSIHQNRDRADAIISLCRIGQRDQALAEMVDALGLDVGVVDALNWIDDPATGERRLAIPGCGVQPPICLIEAVDMLLKRLKQTHENGADVGRKRWMDAYMALRRTGAQGRALELLDFFEAEIPVIERQTIIHERGQIFMDLGDAARALACFQQVYELTGRSPYQADILRASLSLDSSSDGTLPAAGGNAAPLELNSLDEILDQPWAFEHRLEQLAEIAIRATEPATAARLLRRTLLYRDDLIQRADRWERIGDLFLQAGLVDQALDSYREALDQLGAKPFPLSSLQISLDHSRPGRIARSMARAWRAQGVAPEKVVSAAWSLDEFFSHRNSWALFRAVLFAEAGQMDAELREAQIQLLANPDNLLANWSLIEALEGLGRHDEAATAMRELSETFYKASPVSPDRLYAQTVAAGQQRTKDPDAWRDVALIELLRGRYTEAATLLETARELIPANQPRRSGNLAGMQARAVLLSGVEGALEKTRALLQQAVAADPGRLSLARRLETLP